MKSVNKELEVVDMSFNKKDDYYVGIDIGTGSLGVAVTDTEYNLIN